MMNNIFASDLLSFEKTWKKFVRCIKESDLQILDKDMRELNKNLEDYKRLERGVRLSKSNLSMLLNYRIGFEKVFSSDDTIKYYLEVLQGFANRQSLDNDTALFYYDKFSEYALNLLSSMINDTENKIKNVKNQMDQFQSLIYIDGPCSLDFIDFLCQKYSMSDEEFKQISIYMLSVVSRPDPVKKEKKVNRENTDTAHTQVEPEIVIEPIEELEGQISMFEENQELRNKFEHQKNIYNAFISEISPLLNKYYEILINMSTQDKKYYEGYVNVPEEELQEEQYGQTFGDQKFIEAKAKIMAIKLFNMKSELDETITNINSKSPLVEEEIDFLQLYLEELEKIYNVLNAIDIEIEKKVQNAEELDNSKVFFLVDQDGKTHIPEDIIKYNSSSLGNVIEKEQAGFISRKKGSNIMLLDQVNNDKIEGRKVFAFRNTKIIVSYVKLNSQSDVSNDGGILILTATNINGGIETIKLETSRIITKSFEQIIREIGLLESRDLDFMELQQEIRQKIVPQDGKEMGGDGLSER